MNGRKSKNLVDMSGDELIEIIKRLSRYTLAVEMIAIGACLPIITRQAFVLLCGATLLMFIGVIFMRFCKERKKKRWTIVWIIQIVLASLDLLTIILNFVIGIETIVEIMAHVSIGFLWIHCAMCFFEYRRDEEVVFMRFIGAFIVVITIIVCYIMKQLLLSHDIVF